MLATVNGLVVNQSTEHAGGEKEGNEAVFQ